MPRFLVPNDQQASGHSGAKLASSVLAPLGSGASMEGYRAFLTLLEKTHPSEIPRKSPPRGVPRRKSLCVGDRAGVFPVSGRSFIPTHPHGFELAGNHCPWAQFASSSLVLGRAAAPGLPCWRAFWRESCCLRDDAGRGGFHVRPGRLPSPPPGASYYATPVFATRGVLFLRRPG